MRANTVLFFVSFFLSFFHYDDDGAASVGPSVDDRSLELKSLPFLVSCQWFNQFLFFLSLVALLVESLRKRRKERRFVAVVCARAQTTARDTTLHEFLLLLSPGRRQRRRRRTVSTLSSIAAGAEAREL